MRLVYSALDSRGERELRGKGVSPLLVTQTVSVVVAAVVAESVGSPLLGSQPADSHCRLSRPVWLVGPVEWEYGNGP